MRTVVTLLIVLILSSLNTFAQDVGMGMHLNTLEGHSDSVNSVAFSPDGRTITSGSTDDTIRLWDATTGAHQRTLTGHSDSVSSVAFSPDGRTIASVSWDKTIRLWDAGTGTHLNTLGGHTPWFNSVAFSPDGRTIASGAGRTIRLWDAGMGVEQHTLTGHLSWVRSVAFSLNGRTLASGGGYADNTIRLWDAGTGVHQRTLTGHSHWVNSVAFSPDGRTLASGSYDDTIRTWDATTGTRKRILTGHSGSVNSVAFSLDSRILASGSLDGTIRLWDAGTGATLNTLEGHSGSVTSVAFSPDGRTLASGSSDGTVLLWKLIPSATPTATVSVSPTPVPSPAIGEQLTLSLKIAGEETVAGYQATVAFDTTVLRYVSSANGDYLPTGAFFIPPVVAENRVVLASTALAGVGKGDGTLAAITFEVVAIKTSTVTLSQVTLVDPDGERLYPLVENGRVIELPQLFGDVNRDGVVNIQDLVVVGANFEADGSAQGGCQRRWRGRYRGFGGGCWCDTQRRNRACRAFPRTWCLRDGEPVPYSRGCPRLAHSSTRSKPHGCKVPKRDYFLRTSLGNLDSARDSPCCRTTRIRSILRRGYRISLPTLRMLTLTIYDTKGVQWCVGLSWGINLSVIYQDQSRAAHWNGRNANGELVASGVYFYQLRAGNYSALRRMVVVK